jgi:adenine deaminase
MRLGMYVQMREGSAWRDVAALSKAITEYKGPHPLDTRFCCLVSDDVHPNTLFLKGHLDHILRRAVEEGIDVITAIQMLTINTAACYRMENDLGSITPGKCADIVFLNNLTDLQVTRVIIDGEVAAEDGHICFDLPPFVYPDWVLRTMHVREAVTPASFAIPARRRDGSKVKDGETLAVRAMEMIPGVLKDNERHVRLPAAGGFLQLDPGLDILKAFVFERHHDTGTRGGGLVMGFGIKNGALAATVAHDAHNLFVMGSNDEDMALAANTLIKTGGGMIAVQNGQVLGLVPLPVAGLMNTKQVGEMSTLVDELEGALKRIGCTMPNPFLTIAFIPMACLPELRLTNRGLVDCVHFEMVELALE